MEYLCMFIYHLTMFCVLAKKNVSVLLSASVERVSDSCMRAFIVIATKAVCNPKH